MKHRDANVRQASLAGPRRVQPPSSARSAAVFAKQRKRSLLEGPALFEELRALDIRLSRIAASIPFLGPWLIPWRGEMTAIERKRIRKISLTATGLGIVAMAALVFDASSRSLPREKRALSEIQDLGDIVQEFRIRNGVLPGLDNVAAHSASRRPSLLRSLGARLPLQVSQAHGIHRNARPRRYRGRSSRGRRHMAGLPTARSE